MNSSKDPTRSGYTRQVGPEHGKTFVPDFARKGIPLAGSRHEERGTPEKNGVPNPRKVRRPR